MKNYRLTFTNWWDSMSSNLKSLIISGLSIVIAYLSLKLAILAFPGEDFTAVQVAVVTAASGFIINLVKNIIKVE